MARTSEAVSQGSAPATPSVLLPILALVGLKVGIHFAANLITPYEFHRDEFLYFAMGDHFHLWRMDIPPAIAAFSVGVRRVFGDSLLTIRMIPALFGAATIALAGLIVRDLGGRRFAVLLTGVCLLANPLFLRASNLFQPVVMDQFAWTVGFFALARLQGEDHLRWWILLGVGTGFGLLTKLTIGVFGVAVAFGLLMTRGVSWLARPGPWVALVLATLMGLPTLVGQVLLDFPVLGYMADLRENQLARMTVAGFLGGQLEMIGPGAIIGLMGIGALLLHRAMTPFRVLGWTALGIVLLLILLDAKAYYLGPVYPATIAAGAVWIGGLTRPRLRAAVQWGLLALVLAYGVITLPMGLPVLPPERMETYAARIAGDAAVRTNRGDIERIPQDYADMLGWREQVVAVAEVFHGLSPADQEKAVIIGSNYGEAGAIDFYGPGMGLPRALSVVGTYWLYGPGEKPGEVAVVIGSSQEDLKEHFAEVAEVMQLGHPFGVAEERHLAIHVARRPYRSLQEVWPEFKGRN